MATLLKWVGGIWAVLGALNVLFSLSQERSETVLAWGLILNMLIFIFPGLVLLGIGYAIASRSSPPEDFTVIAEGSSALDGETIRPTSFFSAFAQMIPSLVLFWMFLLWAWGSNFAPRGTTISTIFTVGLIGGLLNSLLISPFMKGTAFSVAFRDREKFLAQLQKYLGISNYRRIAAAEDLVVYTKPLELPAAKIFVHFKGDTATIIGPKFDLRKLRTLETHLPSNQYENRILPASGKSSAETRLEELQSLLNKHLITPEEYEKKRAEILQEL